MGTPNWEVEFECQLDHTTGLTNHPNFAMYDDGESSSIYPYGWAEYLPYKIGNLDEVIELNRQCCQGSAVCKVRHGKPLVGKRMLYPKVIAERRFDDVFQARLLAARRRAMLHDDCLQFDDCEDDFVASVGETSLALRFIVDEDVCMSGDVRDLPDELWLLLETV